MKLRNPFTTTGKWYKANLHTHTTSSDGSAGPVETAELYRKAGYHILALTDHDKTNDVRGLSKRNFLVICGMEYHPECPATENPHHLVAINIPHGFRFDEPYPTDGNACIGAVQAAGGESILAHPLWCGHRYDMYAYLTGYIGLEIYNTTCDKIGRSSGELDWAHLLDAGRMLPGVADDDAHREIDRFGGWSWLRLKRLTVAAVMDALRTGCYYSSTGPKITDFRVRRGAAEVTCSPVEFIYLSAQTYHGARRKAEAGKAIRKFICPVGKDWAYVRAVAVDHRGRKAWTNPIVLRPSP
jgi:hypothetical protein